MFKLHSVRGSRTGRRGSRFGSNRTILQKNYVSIHGIPCHCGSMAESQDSQLGNTLRKCCLQRLRQTALTFSAVFFHASGGSYRAKKTAKNWKIDFFTKTVFLTILNWIVEVWGCPGWPHGPYEHSRHKLSRDLVLHGIRKSTFRKYWNFNVLEMVIKTFHFVPGLSRTPLLFIPRYLTNICFRKYC